MKKLLIFLVCILCLTLLIVSCTPKGGDNTETEGTEAAATDPGDINWGELNGTGGDKPTQEYPTADGFNVGTDASNDWSPLAPY